MIVLGNPVAAMFLSFIFGMMGNAMLRRLTIYESLTSRYLFSGSKPYEGLGILWYRKFLLATPLRLFNNDIRFSANRSLETLESVKMHMTNAEVAHWVGFAAMLVLTVPAWWYRGFEIQKRRGRNLPIWTRFAIPSIHRSFSQAIGGTATNAFGIGRTGTHRPNGDTHVYGRFCLFFIVALLIPFNPDSNR